VHEQAVYDSLGGPPNSWSHATTFHNILEKLTPQQVQGSKWTEFHHGIRIRGRA